MPIHPIDEPSLLKVETNVGGEMVDLENTDYRSQQYKRNQQTEPRRRYVVEPLPGTEPKVDEPTQPDVAPVEMSDELQKALNKDLSKRGVSMSPQAATKPKDVKLNIPKPKSKSTID